MSRPTSFYYAFLSLSRRQRDAIVAVWDFCRAVDDTVDEAGSDGSLGSDGSGGSDGSVRSGVPVEQVRGQLQAWREELNACYTGQPATRQGRALQPWIERYELSRQPFEDLIDGVEMDLDRSRYATFDELYQYCWRVASTVGFMCLEIFGVRDAGREYALNLGLALQLTNILRDVKADYERGHIYLPLEDLQRFGCDERELGAPTLSTALGQLLRFEAARAREFYARAAAARPDGFARRLVAAEIMGAIYRDLLATIEARNYDVLSGRVQVSRPRQASIALSTWFRMQLGFDASA